MMLCRIYTSTPLHLPLPQQDTGIICTYKIHKSKLSLPAINNIHRAPVQFISSFEIYVIFKRWGLVRTSWKVARARNNFLPFSKVSNKSNSSKATLEYDGTVCPKSITDQRDMYFGQYLTALFRPHIHTSDAYFCITFVCSSWTYQYDRSVLAITCSICHRHIKAALCEPIGKHARKPSIMSPIYLHIQPQYYNNN